MTSTEFETLAKTAVSSVMHNEHNIDVEPDDIQLVWYAHELGHKKCTMWAKSMGHYYAEVTYDSVKDQMYVDIYLKKTNTAFGFERDKTTGKITARTKIYSWLYCN